MVGYLLQPCCHRGGPSKGALTFVIDAAIQEAAPLDGEGQHRVHVCLEAVQAPSPGVSVFTSQVT